MAYDREKDFDKCKDDKKCECCIKIEDSIVIIICGDVDHNDLKKSLEGVKEVW
ncbi:MAG: hypothetical protein ACOX47_14450 [Bacillota bacterium]